MATPMVGTSPTLQNRFAARITCLVGSAVVSDTFRAAQARSDAIEQQMADDPASLRMLTGDRPTGALHIGHYFGSIRNRLRLQDSGAEIWQLIADYQVITDREVGGDIRGNVRNLLLDYLAAGLDPERATVFTHSAVPALNQLLLPFLSLVSVAELQRNPTVKDEAASAGITSISGAGAIALLNPSNVRSGGAFSVTRTRRNATGSKGMDMQQG